MGELIAAIAGVIGTIIVSLFTYFMARRAGIGPYQDTLVTKLKDLVDVQAQEIDAVKRENLALETRVVELEQKVKELEQLTINQASTINSLLQRSSRRRTVRKTQQEGGN